MRCLANRANQDLFRPWIPRASGPKQNFTPHHLFPQGSAGSFVAWLRNFDLIQLRVVYLFIYLSGLQVHSHLATLLQLFGVGGSNLLTLSISWNWPSVWMNVSKASRVAISVARSHWSEWRFTSSNKLCKNYINQKNIFNSFKTRSRSRSPLS